jgi:hypothetical protein
MASVQTKALRTLGCFFSCALLSACKHYCPCTYQLSERHSLQSLMIQYKFYDDSVEVLLAIHHCVISTWVLCMVTSLCTVHAVPGAWVALALTASWYDTDSQSSVSCSVSSSGLCLCMLKSSADHARIIWGNPASRSFQEAVCTSPSITNKPLSKLIKSTS